jgi:hypothetical protein
MKNIKVYYIIEILIGTKIEVFVGGAFTALSGTEKVDYLSNVARYDVQKKTWSALNGVSLI